jgi:hypothetical protein
VMETQCVLCEVGIVFVNYNDNLRLECVKWTMFNELMVLLLVSADVNLIT